MNKEILYVSTILGLALISGCHAVAGIGGGTFESSTTTWWLDLGLKSPFVIFTTDIETLSNDTAYFNFTQNMNVIQSKIIPTTTTTTTTATTRTTTTTAPLTPSTVAALDFMAMFRHPTVVPRLEPVVEGERAEALGSGTGDGKKYIIPLALRTEGKEKKTTVFHDTLPIDHLKNHIMMMQNFAEAGAFQSKFIVFPHLSNQTEKTETPPPTTTQAPKRRRINNSPRTTSTMMPEVILQNDQTPAGDDPNVDSKERRRLEKKLKRQQRKKAKTNQAQPRRINRPLDQEDVKGRTRRGLSKVKKKSINTIDEVRKDTRGQPVLDPKMCYIPEVLSMGQQKLCTQNILIMPVVSRAARSALQNCQQQFKNRRWDCAPIDDGTVFGPITLIGSPEMAYVHALSAAAAMSFIARACRDGQFASCGCSRGPRPHNLKEDWIWGGCGDDFEFAYKFSQRFVDSREKELRRLTRAIVSAPPIHHVLENLTELSTTTTEATVKISARRGKYSQLEARSVMNLHNNEAGRRAVVKKSRMNCKCHGVSGSCSVITCWQQLTTIKDIAEYLKEKYDTAVHVRLNSRKKLQVREYPRSLATGEDLVHLDPSPDWCRANRAMNWRGTHGRVCNRSSTGFDSCAVLCCGRGYNTKKLVVREKCNCKFHWCCVVKCKTCVKTIEEYTCK